MTQDPHDEEFLGLFKPKDQESATTGGSVPEPVAEAPDEVVSEPDEVEIVGVAREPTWRTVGMFVGGGCLLLLLTAVVVFAFVKVFGDRGGEAGGRDTPTPTQFIVVEPTPTVAVAVSPLIVPLISSSDVHVPVALPERLTIGEKVLLVQVVNTPAGTWPGAPVTNDTVAWAYGTVVNYVFTLAPTAENVALLSALQVGDALSLHMSTGLVLNFDVDEVTTGATDETAFFEQTSPRLTLTLLAADEVAQRTVVSAAFFDDEAGEAPLLSEAAAGMVDIPVDQGPVRVTVFEAYQVAAGEAGLPPGTGYLLVDFAVENIGTQVLQAGHFQTFVSDAQGERYPLTVPAGQFAHHGLPSEPLAPGETVIGSAGYLLPASSEGQVRWAFNPLPGSDNWVLVPVPYELPASTPSPAPPPPAGFARVTVDPNDVFVDRGDGELIVQIKVENISDGVVVVTAEDVGLSSYPGGEATLVSAGPLLPWTIEPGELKLFELHFELPSDDPVLLSVLGYTFEIGNVGRE